MGTVDQDAQLLLCAISHIVMLESEQKSMKIHSEGPLNISNAQMKTWLKVLIQV